MLPPAFRAPLLLTACVSAGLVAGWTVHSSCLFLQTRGSATAPPLSAAGDGSSPDSPGANSAAAAVPFSMEVFRAASGLAMHRMLAQVLPGADAALVRALAEQLAARPEFPPDAVWQAVLSRWVELDPPGALGWARVGDLKYEKHWAIFAIKQWALMDAEAALVSSVTGNYKNELLLVYHAIAEIDPGRAIVLLKEVRKNEDNAVSPLWGGEDVSKFFFTQWGRLDPETAVAFLEKHPEFAPWEYQNVTAGWAEKDPEGCRDWLAGLSAARRKDAMDGLRDAAGKNPAGVAGILSIVTMNDENRQTFLDVASEWAARDAVGATAWVKERFPEGAPRRFALGKVAEKLILSDLSSAVAIMEEIGWIERPSSQLNTKRILLPGESGVGDTVIREDEHINYDPQDPFRSEPSGELVMAKLGKEDPALALRYVGKASPAGQVPLLRTFVPAWFQRDPEAVTRWLETLPPERMLETKDLTGLLLDFTGLNSQKAQAWAGRLPPGNLQQALAGLAFRSVDVEDPVKAVESIPFTDPASRQAALEQIVLGWSGAAPQEALDRLVGGSLASPGVCQEVVEEWTLHDPAAASTWVAAQPPGPNRDGAIRGLAARLIDENAQPDFPAALVWSLSITEPGVRLETARSVLEKWQGNAPEAAEMRGALEATTALPEPDRQTLLQRLTP